MSQSMPHLPIALLIALCLSSSCQSGGQALVEPEPDHQSEPDLQSEPEDQSEPEHQSDPDPLSSGTYWVRRINGMTIGRLHGHVAGEPARSELQGQTGCARFDVILDTIAPEVRFLPKHSTRVRFFISEDEGIWTLRSARLEEEHVEISRGCSQTLTLAPQSPDAGYVDSSAGPLFLDRETCMAQPSSFVMRCEDEDCSYVQPLARPFDFGTCEEPIAQLQRLASAINETSHDEAMQTLKTLEQRAQEGGELWERHGTERGETCLSVTLNTTEEELVRLKVRVPEDEGYVEHEEVYRLSPLHHRAHRYGQMFTTYTRDGEVMGMGASGSSGLGQQPLYLARDAIVIDERVLFLEASACSAGL